MADEGVSTPLMSTKRKKVASPLLDEDGHELDAEGNVVKNTSPVPMQDPKKLIIEAESESIPETGHAGNEPKGQGHTAKTTNMATTGPKQGENDEANVEKAGTSTNNRPSRGVRRDPIPIQPTTNKRGRPRKRALSMEPVDNIGKQDLYSLLLDIKQTNSTLGNDLAKTIDHKMNEVKNELCIDLKDMKLEICKNTSNIANLESVQSQHQNMVTDLELKIVDLEDELNLCGKRVGKNVLEVNEHIQNVECALASDIETIKVGTESKLHDIEEKQKEGENRLMEIAQRVEQDNAKMKLELDELKVSLGKLQNITESLEQKCQPPQMEGSSLGASQSSFENINSNKSSTSNLFQDVGGNELDRTLIVNGVRESFRGDLKLVVKDFAREVGCTLTVDDIESVYRIGPFNCKIKAPRPVKLVLKDPVKRDQIFLFKARLRFSPVFKGIKVHKEEHRELRVRGAILQQAATIARGMGHTVYARPGSIDVDGCEYNIENIEEIPSIFRLERQVPISPRTSNEWDKTRKRAERVHIVGTSLQKLSYGLGFFSAGCYLSNFFACDFVCRNTPFRSVEQGYQALKALICKRPDIYQQIMNTPFPATAKSLARYITTTREWENSKLAIMEELIYCKFRQNKQLYYQLLNTRPNALFECTTDEFWGTGCRFGSIAMEENDWNGNNNLGKLLMKVREQLASEWGRK